LKSLLKTAARSKNLRITSIMATIDAAQRRGFMLVLSSPSGAGKTTLSRRLLTQHHGLALSISVTTRPARPREMDGQDYRFIDEPDFNAMAARKELLEYATVFGHHYGTPADAVEDHLQAGRDVLFDIDWQGTRQLAQMRRDDLVSIFILPPSMAELERRLRQRGQDSDEVIAQRMSRAAEEISHWDEYDYVLVNEDLDKALANIVHIIEAERQRRERQVELPAYIQTLISS
jgi:guanylate kinase